MLGISYKDFVPHSTELAPPHHLWWSPPPITGGERLTELIVGGISIFYTSAFLQAIRQWDSSASVVANQ
jgi:hypothetical protein